MVRRTFSGEFNEQVVFETRPAGFLNYGPMTGYELKQTFDSSVRRFWNSSLSRVYPMPAAMEDEGLATMELQVQDGRPNRKELERQRGLLANYTGPVREGLRETIESAGLARDGLFWSLTLEAGLRHVKASIEWPEESIRKIEESRGASAAGETIRNGRYVH